jgi:putative membrane protein
LSGICQTYNSVYNIYMVQNNLHNPYANYTKEELILRDLLAADRTELANETTFLAYVRTSFALLLAGVSLWQFFQSNLGIVTGTFFLFSSAVLLVIGYRRYKAMEEKIYSIRSEAKVIDTEVEAPHYLPKTMIRMLYNHSRPE